MRLPLFVIRLRWRWQYRATRRAAAAELLTPQVLARACAVEGHLNTATGQWADVILARARKASR